MKRKKAVITMELLDEVQEESDEKVAEELLDWFREDAVSIPWVKAVKKVTIEEE